jgi:uncharacterized RDD family membrane protein YckC
MAAQISSVPQENALEENKAGFIVRAAAAIVDGFLLGSVTIPMSFLALTTLGEAGKVVSRFIAFLPLVYQTLAVGLYGKTIGKYFFNLQVVTTNHTKPGMAKAFLREVVGKLLSSVVLSLGYFWIIWDKNKQGWHDKIANTFVIQEKPIGGVKKAFAYFFVLGLPILAILGIMAVVFLVATNPLGR